MLREGGCSVIAFALLLTSLPRVSVAAEMDYPELQVVPRASERLKMEAEKDAGFKLVSWPILIPAVATLGLGVMNTNATDPFRDPSRLGVYFPGVVGLAWIGVSVYLAAAWSPYRSGWATVKESSGGGRREQLTRERLAEEELASAARSSFIVSIAATVTLGGAAAVSGTMSAGPASGVLSIAVGVLALAPVLLSMRPTHVYNQHLEYKKKIYSPISSVTLMPEPVTSRLAPGVAIALAF